MKIRLPLFGLVRNERSPMNGLIEHYEQISKGMGLIEESMECYITGGTCKDFNTLLREVDEAEEHADKIKRNIRNHLPRALFMAVDKTLFINYTRSQDNILDAGQEALNWLGMRRMPIPEEFQKEFVFFLHKVSKTIELLRPALEATVGLVHGDGKLDRLSTKNTYRAIRAQQREVFRERIRIVSAVYRSDLDFKDIYQLIHFVDALFAMSHNAENCSDMLRSMIAR